MRRSVRNLAVLVAVATGAGLPSASALAPGGTPELPVLSEELQRGAVNVVDLAPVAATPKTVDGDPADWIGTPSGFGGTALVSAGELVYQDHLFDARGADDGTDAERAATFDTLASVDPRTYRAEALFAQDPAGQVGAPAPEQVRGDEYYGDAGFVAAADLVEVRATALAGVLHLLVRTSTMTDDSPTAVVVLIDDAPGGGGPVPFGTGLTSATAERALLLTGDGGWVADLASETVEPLPGGSVATDATGWTNALEAAVPAGPGARIALASGRAGSAGTLATLAGPDGSPLPSNLANVAFRTGEPVRTWFDRTQALALNAGSIDAFFAAVPDGALGGNQALLPRPGYHDRIFRSAEAISAEGALETVWQHYGLYLPDAWTGGAGAGAFPLQWWFHWRGGAAHSAAAAIPRMYRTLGDGEASSAVTTGIADSVVVAPRGRGTSTWYVGRGHADFLEVWDDVFALLGDHVDERRVYVTGHSMGGWASYLMPILYPDRFAGTMPYAGPVTQGAWTGLDVPGCDNLRSGDNTPCYIAANGSRPRDQHTRRLLENLRHVPVSVMHGAADELVPVSGVTRQVERLVQLGYRHRYYLFPAYEHFSHPVADEWADAARYVHRFRSPVNPARVTYIRDVAFERATEEVQAGGFTFDFTFDRAYWMRGLTPAEGAAAAAFDGRSLAIAEPPTATTPEAGGPAPGQYGPFVMTGLAWTEIPLAPQPTSNGFEVTLRGTASVELDLARMAIDSDSSVAGLIDADRPFTLRLDGDYAAVPPVTCAACLSVPAHLEGGVLVLQVPAGVYHIGIG